MRDAPHVGNSGRESALQWIRRSILRSLIGVLVGVALVLTAGSGSAAAPLAGDPPAPVPGDQPPPLCPDVGAASASNETAATEFCTFSNPQGYQFLVPSAWQPVPVEGGDVLLRSPDGLQLADIVVTDVPTDLAGVIAVTSDVIRDYRDGLHATDFQQAESSASIPVPNADDATFTSLQYRSRQGIARTAFFLIVFRGPTLYIVVIDTTDAYLQENVNQGLKILQSFQLTP